MKYIYYMLFSFSIAMLISTSASSNDEVDTGIVDKSLIIPYSPSILWNCYPISCSYNDIQFVPLCDFTTLTPSELFVLNGSELENGISTAPWWYSLSQQALTYAYEYGSIPEYWDIESQARAIGESIQDFQADVETQKYSKQFVSPISGRFPKLLASEFSPGDVYIKILTDEEILAINDKLGQSYPGLDKLPTGDDKRIVLYWRLYGVNSVLQTTLIY